MFCVLIRAMDPSGVSRALQGTFFALTMGSAKPSFISYLSCLLVLVCLSLTENTAVEGRVMGWDRRSVCRVLLGPMQVSHMWAAVCCLLLEHLLRMNVRPNEASVPCFFHISLFVVCRLVVVACACAIP